VADKLEVLSGPGLVARYDDVAVWAGPQSSAALQTHLVNEAQRVAKGPNGGDQLANSLIGVLQRGDPEPQAPFAVVGPGANGLTLFLHGPVQAWDSGRWLAPQPVPGWMVTSVGRPWPLIILPYGASPPPQSQQGNPFDLVAGAVPGAGFVMLRPPAGPVPAGATPQMAAASQPSGTAYGAAGMGTAGAAAGLGAAGTGAAAAGEAGTALAVAAGAAAAGGLGTSSPEAQAPTSVSAAAMAVPATPGIPTPSPTSGGNVIDLRSVFAAGRPALALASTAAYAFSSDLPEVAGVRCELGHFNHPRATSCLRCGRPIPPGSPQVTGPRPPLGVLLADDGAVWPLSRGCLIGTDPASAPEVQSGAVEAIAMRAGANHAMAPVQAEVQVRAWSTYLVDRGAEGGTWLQGPSAQTWEQLGRNEQRELASGSHLSCGGRVLTFLSAWPA